MNDATIRKILAEAENQPAMIETKTEIFVAENIRFDGNQLIKLETVYNLKDNSNFEIGLNLRLHEVRTVRKLKPCAALEKAEGNETIMYLDKDDIESIRNQVNNIIYIKHYDSVYRQAVKDLKAESNIGVLVTPFSEWRECPLTLIVVSTSKAVYFFDLMTLGGLFKELKQVLVQDRTQKVMYRSDNSCDKIQLRYNIKINAVFDMYLPSQRFGFPVNIELEEFTGKIFNLPKLFFEGEHRNKRHINTSLRPLQELDILLLAQTAILLLKSSYRILWGYFALTSLQQNNESALPSQKSLKDELNAQTKAQDQPYDIEKD